MTERDAGVSRRGFLKTAAGGAAVASATGTAAAQDGNESSGNQTTGTATGGNETSGGGGGGGGTPSGPPDFGGYLDGANNYGGSVTDATGQDEVTVEVGAGDGLAFGPAAVKVDNGATVVWEWTGNGGAHNVVSDSEVFNSGSPVSEAGTTFEFTFEEDGIYNYFCSPHQGQGMLGSVVVGTDYPTKAPQDSGGGGISALPDTAKTLGVATSVVMSATLGLAYFFMKYGGDYETPN